MLKFTRLLHQSTKLSLSFKHETIRNTVGFIRDKYLSQTPISVVTAHDFITAKFAEQANIDINLIGDSLAMTAVGYQDTNEITMEEFIFHAKSVQRGNAKSLLIADLIFGSYELSPHQALQTAITMVKTGKVQGVKVEGGKELSDTISLITKAGIPVMGHAGLTPQRHNNLSGFKLQGNTVESAVQIYEDCLALQQAGCFAIVLECVPNKLSEIITAKLSIPTIGIGAGPGCSGQVMVIADLLGMNGPQGSAKSKFVKEYANVYDVAVASLEQYKQDLHTKQYPNADLHGYKIKKDVLQEFKARISQ